MEANKEAVSGQEELAQRIYVELVGRSFDPADGSGAMRVKSASLSQLSLQLAAGFYEGKAAVEAARAPKKDFTLDSSKIAEWMK